MHSPKRPAAIRQKFHNWASYAVCVPMALRGEKTISTLTSPPPVLTYKYSCETSALFVWKGESEANEETCRHGQLFENFRREGSNQPDAELWSALSMHWWLRGTWTTETRKMLDGTRADKVFQSTKKDQYKKLSIRCFMENRRTGGLGEWAWERVDMIL